MTSEPLSPLSSAGRVPETSDSADTKERLLAAGAKVFAELGFDDATVRQICAVAGANPAAVNYHFGDKQRFYAEVLATSHQRAAAKRPMPRLADDPEHPERVLRAWIRWLLELMLVEASGPLGKLMAREMADPTVALDELVRRSIGPMHRSLSEVVAALLPRDASPEQVHLYVGSALGQCLFFKHSVPVFAAMRRQLERQVGMPAIGPGDLEKLTDHVTGVSLAAMRAAREEAR